MYVFFSADQSFFEKVAMRFVAGFVVLYVFFLVAPLSAQPAYKGWPLPAKIEEEESKKTAAVSNALQSGSIDKATFDTYFGKYYFSRWTQPDRTSLLNGYVRKDFLGNDLAKATGEARRMLLDITVRAMKRMKSDPNVYPVAQVNAVVVLSNLYEDLDKQIPYGPAIPVLLEELANEKAPVANQVTALDGLVRYAYLGIADPKLRDKDLPALFSSIAKEQNAPDGRDAEIHTLFFRARAVDGLGALCRTAKPAPGESADALTGIVETLLEIIEDRDEKSNEVRNNAMNALAELNLVAASAGGVKLDSARIVDVIVSFARATCDRQQQFIEETRRSEQVSTSGGMRGGMSGMGGDMGGMSSMSSGMSMGMGASSSSDKMIRRIEECIGSSKFAFGTVLLGAIRGPAGGARNEMNIIALLNKENTPESAESVKRLNDIQKITTDFITFLNNGPPVARRQQQTTRTPTSGTMPGGNTTAVRGNAKMPKVTMDDIYNELTVLATKFDELASKARNKG